MTGAGRIKLRADALQWREIEDEIVGVDTRTSTYVAVNQSGAVLWPALAEGTTRAALVASLVEAFGLDARAAEADVDNFLTALGERHLLEGT